MLIFFLNINFEFESNKNPKLDQVGLIWHSHQQNPSINRHGHTQHIV